MTEFNASLLREKFVLQDTMPADEAAAAPVIATSNRLVLALRGKADDQTAETFIVRAQNMHSCARLGAQVIAEFQDKGPLTARAAPFDWAGAYQRITEGYEENWNASRWIAVYHKGRVIFEGGTAQRHLFLDIVEQCDARNKGDYEKALEVARDAFKHAGKVVTIKHDSNIALVLTTTDSEGRCGLIVRGPARTTTFNMIVRRKGASLVRPSQCLTTAAAFLEGIQLSFLIGMTKQKLNYELIAPHSPEAQQARDAGHRIARLNDSIAQLDTLLDVTYRPERPDFNRMIDEAREYARRALAQAD